MPRRKIVRLTVRKTVVVNEKKKPQEGIVAECPQCRHQVTCYGASVASERRACSVMASECPEELASVHWYTTQEIEIAEEDNRSQS